MLKIRILNLLKNILQPHSTAEDDKRREYILTLLLLGLIILCGVALLISTIFFLLGVKVVSLPSLALILVTLFALLYLSKKGFYKIASYFSIFLLTLACMVSSLQLGIDVPQDLLILALVIIIAGILISSKAAFVMALIISALTIGTQLLQMAQILPQQREWRTQLPTIGDAILFSVTFFIITLVSWLSNREIEKSLRRARKSEAELLEERDKLEIKVEERTRELKAAQLSQLAEMSRFAEFGKLTTGVIHDLVNPLTAISLCLKEVKTNSSGDNIQGAEYFIREALAATKKMENFIANARKQMSMAEIKSEFNLAKEISDSISLLNFKAREKHVKFVFDLDKNIVTFGNPLKFSQVINNLANNAIDAFPEEEPLNNDRRRQVAISCKEKNNSIKVVVEDNGPGISDSIRDKIFDPYFTTKDFDRGMGIGLSIVKDVIDNHFHGSIEIESNISGTKIQLNLPHSRVKNG